DDSACCVPARRDRARTTFREDPSAQPNNFFLERKTRVARVGLCTSTQGLHLFSLRSKNFFGGEMRNRPAASARSPRQEARRAGRPSIGERSATDEGMVDIAPAPSRATMSDIEAQGRLAARLILSGSTRST